MSKDLIREACPPMIYKCISCNRVSEVNPRSELAKQIGFPCDDCYTYAGVRVRENYYDKLNHMIRDLKHSFAEMIDDHIDILRKMEDK